MKILIQRVLEASVEVDHKIIGKIHKGALVFVGVTHEDTLKDVHFLVNKLLHLRIFEDEEGKMNKSLIDLKRQVLVVSQFTLYGDCSAGRRPSFIEAAKPEYAKELYEKFIQEVRQSELKVETGEFGAHMKISLINDGPVTFMIESSE